MAEQQNTVEATEPTDEKKPNFITRFRTNHPRKFKAAVVTAVAGAAVVIGAAVANKKNVDFDFEPETLDTSADATDTPSEA